MAGRERFVEQPIEALADDLLFTAIDTGNPHLVARVGRIDLERLDELGRRANGMRDILPHGVNLSLCEQRDEERMPLVRHGDDLGGHGGGTGRPHAGRA